VLHSDDASGERTRRRSWADIPCVVIGSAKLNPERAANERQHYLQKPFCYGELIRAIEELLSGPARS
jgi:hypothetical protein